MKKQWNKSVSVILTLALMAGMAAFAPIHAQAKKSMGLSKKKLTLEMGKSYRLRVKNTKKKVKWTSAKKKIATVSSKGVIKAKKEGKVNIFAKVGKKKFTCKVTVTKKTTVKASVAPTGTRTNKPVATEKSVTTEKPVITSQPTAPAQNQNTMSDIPEFLSFKSYDGKAIVESKKSNKFTIKSETEDVVNNKINSDEMLLLKLSYENKKRDSIVEIVLNDSDYGKKQIYTTAASVNKIESSDTYYDDERDTYVTDVLLKMPKTKSSTSRQIAIEETCFLRETVGLKGYADMQHASQISVNFEVSSTPLPSYSVYFNFVENSGTYTLLSLSNKYELPDVLYIPDTYEGLPVTALSDTALDKAPIKKLIIPTSVRTIGNNLFNCTAPLVTEIQMMNESGIPSLGTFALDEKQLNGKCKIVVPKCMAWRYLQKSNYSNGWQAYMDLIFYQETDGSYVSVSNATEDMCTPDDDSDVTEFALDLSSQSIVVTLNTGGDSETKSEVTRNNGKIQLWHSRMNMIDFDEYFVANNIELSDYNKLTMDIRPYDMDGKEVEIDDRGEKFALVTRENLNGFANSDVSPYNYFSMPEVVMDLSEVELGATGMNVQFNFMLREYPQIAYFEISSIKLS